MTMLSWDQNLHAQISRPVRARLSDLITIAREPQLYESADYNFLAIVEHI
jgi:hypothetical protein